MNLQTIRKTRPQLKEGDVFVFELPAKVFHVGMVVGANLAGRQTPWDQANLVYLYNYCFPSIPDAIPRLSPNRLAIPPVFVARNNWTRGYFVNLGHKTIAPDDLLESTCFRKGPERFVNERREPMQTPTEPCGVWGMWASEGIDEQLSRAWNVNNGPSRV